jgi:lipopolysaccharide cholinephosphotransferase
MSLSFPMRNKSIRDWIYKQTIKYNGIDTDFYGFFYGRTRYHNSVVRKSLYGEPQYVPFENIKLPVPEHYHEYLTQMFGDYMKLPPVEQRQGLHCISVDFGEY